MRKGRLRSRKAKEKCGTKVRKEKEKSERRKGTAQEKERKREKTRVEESKNCRERSWKRGVRPGKEIERDR
jgi:hypothetical protein